MSDGTNKKTVEGLRTHSFLASKTPTTATIEPSNRKVHLTQTQLQTLVMSPLNEQVIRPVGIADGFKKNDADIASAKVDANNLLQNIKKIASGEFAVTEEKQNKEEVPTSYSSPFSPGR